MPRKCVNHPNFFCYICGELTFKYQKPSFTPLLKKCYEQYFKCKVGDEDKSWAPHICCVTCVRLLTAWTKDKVVCYHGTWSRYRQGNGKFTVNQINPNLCTHLIYSFVGINTDGTILLLDGGLDIDNGNFRSFNNLRQRNNRLKTLVAIGGWSEGSSKFSIVAASPKLRATFIQSALDLVRTHGFDGFDLDWEYPGQRGGSAADVANFATLIKEFRAVFDKYGLLLTAAVAASPNSVDLSYDVPALSRYLDFINVMAYDLHGSWDGVTGQNAPLYASSRETGASRLLNVDAAIRGWIDRGADPQKLVLGLGVYGRTYTLSSTANTVLGAPVSGAGNLGPYTQEAGMLGYNEIIELLSTPGWTTVWDDEQKVPYSYKGNQWVGYDNSRSIAIKVNYARSLNLGGVMIWSIETEDFSGASGTAYPLLNAINSGLGIAVESNDGDSSSGNESPSIGGEASSNDNPPAWNDVPANGEGSSSSSNGTGSGGSSSGGTTTSELCTKAGYVRDPQNCNVFYYCLPNGDSYVPLTHQCNSGLYFDEAAQTCNWPQLVSGC